MVVGKESKSGSFVVVIFKIREVPACEMVKKEILRDEGIWWCRRKKGQVLKQWPWVTMKKGCELVWCRWIIEVGRQWTLLLMFIGRYICGSGILKKFSPDCF